MGLTGLQEGLLDYEGSCGTTHDARSPFTDILRPPFTGVLSPSLHRRSFPVDEAGAKGDVDEAGERGDVDV